MTKTTSSASDDADIGAPGACAAGRQSARALLHPINRDLSVKAQGSINKQTDSVSTGQSLKYQVASDKAAAAHCFTDSLETVLYENV